MKKIFIIFLISNLYSSNLLAGSIQVAQWIPWSFVKKELIHQKLDAIVEEDQVPLILGELTPVLRGLSFNLKGGLTDLKIDQVGISAVATGMYAEIKLTNLSIDQFITREFGGNRIRIQLKANCSEIRINIPHFTALMNADFIQGAKRWLPQINELKLQIPSQGWSVSPVTCTGISGADDEISTLIQNSLNDPSLIEGFIHQWLALKVSEMWQATWSDLVLSASPDLLNLEMQAPQSQGLFILAELVISKNKKVLLPILEQSKFNQNMPQLILSQEGFHALLEDKFLSLSPTRYNLQKVEGFSGLMKSRLKQTLTWPDLKRFPTNTPFYLTSFPHESRLLLKQKTKDTWQAQLNANGVLQTEIQSAQIDYLYWGMSVESQMQASVKSGVLKISTGKSTMALAWGYAPIYQLIFNPKNRISTDILKSSINSLFSNQTIEQDLPTLNIDGRIWKLQNWSNQDEFISMDWSEEVI